MKIRYANEKIKQQCTSLKSAKKLFGGNTALAISLQSRINMLTNAEVVKDIILTPQLHFHKLQGDREGTFAIDVKSRRDKWRIILRPLDENEQEYNPCHIDEISNIVKIVKIEEVSAHYE